LIIISEVYVLSDDATDEQYHQQQPGKEKPPNTRQAIKSFQKVLLNILLSLSA